ncbi:hypothetical protein ACEPPN_007159 [Leptodophora sp. 'Broadleaf-Isolate-01']
MAPRTQYQLEELQSTRDSPLAMWWKNHSAWGGKYAAFIKHFGLGVAAINPTLSYPGSGRLSALHSIAFKVLIDTLKEGVKYELLQSLLKIMEKHVLALVDGTGTMDVRPSWRVTDKKNISIMMHMPGLLFDQESLKVRSITLIET